MRSLSKLTLLLVLAAAVATSCKKPAPKQALHIPKDAVFVGAINTKAIAGKIAKSELTLENLFKGQDGADSAAQKGKKEWEEFQNSGVDLSKDFFLAVVQKGGGMTMSNTKTIFAGMGSVDDAGKLENYIKKKKPGTEIRKEKDYQYANIDESMVAWNKDMVMMFSTSGQSAGRMEYDTITGEFNFIKPESSLEDLKAEATKWFNLKEEESVASIPEFRELIQENADGSFWVNSSASAESMPLPLPKVKELVQNNFTAATLNFEDGKIAVKTRSYNSEALGKLLEKYHGEAVDLAMVERHPSKNINGFMAFSFNPQLITAIVNHLELKGMADQQISKAFGENITVEDITKAIKGDFALIISDFNMNTAPAGGLAGFKNPVKIMLNLPVGDKTQMNRLLDKLVEMQMMEKAGNEYRATDALANSGMHIVADDKNLLLSTDLNTLNQYRSGTAKNSLGKDVKDGLSGKSAAMYFNIESMLNGFTAQQNAEAGEIMPLAKATFRDVKGYADTYNGKYTEGYMELRLKNEKENSLAGMLKFFAAAGKEFDKQKSKKMSFDVEDIDVEEVESY